MSLPYKWQKGGEIKISLRRSADDFARHEGGIEWSFVLCEGRGDEKFVVS